MTFLLATVTPYKHPHNKALPSFSFYLWQVFWREADNLEQTSLTVCSYRPQRVWQWVFCAAIRSLKRFRTIMGLASSDSPFKWRFTPWTPLHIDQKFALAYIKSEPLNTVEIRKYIRKPQEVTEFSILSSSRASGMRVDLWREDVLYVWPELTQVRGAHSRD